MIDLDRGRWDEALATTQTALTVPTEPNAMIALPRRPATWFAIGDVVVGGSIRVFMLYLVVLRHWEASRAAYLTMLVPPVAVALSSWLDHEPITTCLLVGVEV